MKRTSTKTSAIPGIVLVVLLITVVIGITGMFFDYVGQINAKGIISENFVDLQIATMLIWGLCIWAMFIVGRDAIKKQRRIGKKMVITAIVCTLLTCSGVAAGFLYAGTYNSVAAAGFIVAYLTQACTYITAFILWLSYD